MGRGTLKEGRGDSQTDRVARAVCRDGGVEGWAHEVWGERNNTCPCSLLMLWPTIVTLSCMELIAGGSTLEAKRNRQARHGVVRRDSGDLTSHAENKSFVGKLASSWQGN